MVDGQTFRSAVMEELPTILEWTINLSLRVDDRGCKIVHESQRRLSNRARRKTYESCSRTRYE